MLVESAVHQLVPAASAVLDEYVTTSGVQRSPWRIGNSVVAPSPLSTAAPDPSVAYPAFSRRIVPGPRSSVMRPWRLPNPELCSTRLDDERTQIPENWVATGWSSYVQLPTQLRRDPPSSWIPGNSPGTARLPFFTTLPRMRLSSPRWWIPCRPAPSTRLSSTSTCDPASTKIPLDSIVFVIWFPSTRMPLRPVPTYTPYMTLESTTLSRITIRVSVRASFPGR